jgi:hypothetical protein
VKLIRAIDLGGQFYSRKNTGFQPMNTELTQGEEY